MPGNMVSVKMKLSGSNLMVEVKKNVICLAIIDGGAQPRTSVVLGGHQLEDRLLEFDLNVIGSVVGIGDIVPVMSAAGKKVRRTVATMWDEYAMNREALGHVVFILQLGKVKYWDACEAAWRIYDFDIHYQTPSVERLPFHLENEQSAIFDATESIDYTLDKSSINETKFEAWMELNKTDTFAQTLLYVEIPKYYDDLKEYDDVVYPTYREACYARGLLEDDKENIDGLLEARL
ncbi:putative PIF1 DNA helicase/replication protein A1-like protein [Tanacetum coccineum]